MHESRNLNGTSIISGVFLPVIIVQIFLYIVSATDIGNNIAAQLSMYPRDMYFLLAPAAYFAAVMLICLFDGGAKDDYTEDETAADIKGTLIYYLKKYLVGDIVIAAITAIVFTVLHFMGNITPILAFLFSRQAFLFGLIFAVIFLFAMRVLSLAAAMIFWRIGLLDSMPVRIASAVINGILITVLAIPIGILVFLLVQGAFELFSSVVAIGKNAYDTVNKAILGASFTFALPAAWSIIYKRNNERKVDFLYETEGYIDAKEGIVLHAKAYRFEELATAVTVYTLSSVLTLAWNIPSAFLAMYSLGGVPLTLICGFFLAFASELFAVYSSQKSWRIAYFLDIFGHDVRRV